MAGRSPAEAVNAFLAPLQQSISCVANAVLHVRGGYYPGDKPRVLTIGSGKPVPLVGERRLALRGAMLYRIIEAPGGRWSVSIAGYEYALDDLESRQEIISFHWDPVGDSPVTTPHLHIACSQPGFPITRKQHIPTGCISLEEFLRFAITELGVRPRKKNWAQILDRNRRAAVEHTTA